jgi:redox-sensitive bicupin YhaK (pirin superfamily)
MKQRTIKRILKPELNYVGDLVAYHFNDLSFEEFDPFLMLAHHGPQKFERGNNGLPFAPHPHRGFETVTFIFEGDVMHHDSNNITSIIKEGGVQWMTAARGIVHTEDTSKEFKENGGMLDIAQLWINLPAKLKMTQPHYQGLNKEDIPIAEFDGGKVKVHAISGSFGDTTGKVKSISGIDMATLNMEPGARYETEVDAERNILLYVLSGDVTINGKEMSGRALVLFDDDGTSITIEAKSKTQIIFGTGVPYREKVAAYGPFVMNNMTEIMEAQRDYNMGKMGVLFE